MKRKFGFKLTKKSMSVILAVLVVASQSAELLKSIVYADTYESIYTFEDNFNRSNRDINGNNGWISQYAGNNPASSHRLENNYLLAEDFSDCNGACTSITERPMKEAAVNQRVGIDILNLGDISNGSSANLHLRVMHGAHADGSDIGYFLEVTHNSLRILRTTDTWTTAALTKGGEKTDYTIDYTHSYRAELVALGSNPTVLTATLYDITDNNAVVAAVSGTDTTSELQHSGTAAVSYTRNSVLNAAKLDNFKYEQIGKMVTQDTFNRANGKIGNNWKQGSLAKASITSKVLKYTTNHTKYDFTEHVAESALVRPLSEAALNQVVEVDFKKTDKLQTADLGAAVIARAQGESITGGNSYVLTAKLNQGRATNQKGTIELTNSLGAVVFSSEVNTDNAGKFRLQLIVTSINEEKTSLTGNLYSLDNNGNATLCFTESAVDDDPNLQKAGTAGISVYDKFHGSLDVFAFKYMSFPEVKIESEEGGEVKLPILYEDGFDVEDGDLHGTNGWSDQSYLYEGKKIAAVNDGKLILSNPTANKSEGAWTRKLMRPLSEACLNQRVSVDVLNLGEVEHVAVSLRFAEAPYDINAINRQGFYSLIVEPGRIYMATMSGWTIGAVAGSDFDFKEGHVYRVVATAQGSLPTKLTCELYDVTDGEKLVCKATGSDQSVAFDGHSAQIPGTVGLSYRGLEPAVLDNFRYEQLDKAVAIDGFNRADGSVDNGWAADSAVAITSNELSLNNGGTDNMWDAAVMRPMSEAKLNQLVAVDYSRPDTKNESSPIIFARAQTDASVTVDGKLGFAGYYAKLTYTGDWSSKLCIYKVDVGGKTTLLSEKDTGINGKLSAENVNVMLTAEGSNPTKLTAFFTSPQKSRNYLIINNTVYDDQPELQKAGTAGVSYADSVTDFKIDRFQYSEPIELPADPELPEDLEGDYMAFFRGTVAAGNFMQWLELDPDKTYIYTVRFKRILDSGGFACRIYYNRQNWGQTMDGEAPITSYSIDETNCIHTLEFSPPANAQVLPNGKVRIGIGMHEGGLSSTGYATDFHVYEKDDPDKTNLVINPNFKKGLFGWVGQGIYFQGATEPNVMTSLGEGEVELVKYDELAFIRDDSDIYFDDGDWAAQFEDGSVLGEAQAKDGVVKGTLTDFDGNPISGATVILDPYTYITTTDKNGSFEFKDLPIGRYIISILLSDGDEAVFDDELEVKSDYIVNVELDYDGDVETVDIK